jgi:CBS-domain-containing membrane protein
LEAAFRLLHTHEVKVLPVVDPGQKVVETLVMADYLTRSKWWGLLRNRL